MSDVDTRKIWEAYETVEKSSIAITEELNLSEREGYNLFGILSLGFLGRAARFVDKEQKEDFRRFILGEVDKILSNTFISTKN